jgi:hypothetical protein
VEAGAAPSCVAARRGYARVAVGTHFVPEPAAAAVVVGAAASASTSAAPAAVRARLIVVRYPKVEERETTRAGGGAGLRRAVGRVVDRLQQIVEPVGFGQREVELDEVDQRQSRPSCGSLSSAGRCHT